MSEEERSTNYFWYPLVEEFTHKSGWLINILPTTIKPKNSDEEFSGVILFFMEADGTTFRCNKIFEPYFYVMQPFSQIDQFREHKNIRRIEEVDKIDLGRYEKTRKAYKFVFKTVKDLTAVRAEVRKVPNVEMREYDVIYYERFCIDTKIRVGNWYDIDNIDGSIELTQFKEDVAPPQPRILAFDIECAKEELNFPNSDKDEIMMISYMVDGMGYLIINQNWFSKKIESFEYSPLEENFCEFHVTNYPNEYEMLKGWFEHIRKIKPQVMVTFNGDAFDWPYIDKRASICGLSMFQEIGFYKNQEDVYISKYDPHIDCFHWVQRDSYLPNGSRGLKAVTKAKLNYNPLELDPELMCPLAMSDPQRLANYSVSDAYATYYLYMKYIHPFIFSLATVIPLNADDCLRKGTGTLCESLLMARAFEASIFFPNKSTNQELKTYESKLLLSETYVGGRVEALQSGIFRDDIPTNFNLVPKWYDEIIGRVPSILDFVLNVEYKGSVKKDDIENYDEIQNEIIEQLKNLRDNPHRMDTPIVIHLDVAAMYPNIILTNRLQPTAIVTEEFCKHCPMRSEDNSCQRRMKWNYRYEYFPSNERQNAAVLRQLESEWIDGIPWHQLDAGAQAKYYKQRLTDFCKKNYQKAKESEIKKRESIICMKSNDFYIETVRSFRDRRYEFKNLVKVWNKKRASCRTPAEREEAKKMIVLYDSMQLAHKALLNSFYGYVMRGGARWRSMEMAGVVTHTGAKIIKRTRRMMEGLGKPLELDTDGIWTSIPPSFPMTKEFKLKDGSKRQFSFPCSLLNHNVDVGFSNHQYHQQLRDDPNDGNKFLVRKENSIFFELDGPYHAMFLPAAREEKKKLKKRYAVYNSHGHITELKGFEIKRRGEWKMIKMMQKDAFAAYMYGTTTQEVYDSVAAVCKQYLNILLTQGRTMEDEELIDMMSESSTMSKSLAEYGDRKSNAITTARRLVEIHGESIINSPSLKCEYIISRLPATEKVSGRSIPVKIFQARPDVTIKALQKWCGDPNIKSNDFRDIIDWEYYTDRLHGALQKILVIPAHLQGIKISNFNVPPPDWLVKRRLQEEMNRGQTNITQWSTATKTPMLPLKATAKYVRDTSKLTPYQLALLEVKKKWRQSRAAIRHSAISVRNFTEWRVVEIRPTSAPGIVSVFVQTSLKTIKKLDVKIPRTFYINSTKQAAETFATYLKGKTKVVKKRLPHGFEADTITQFTLSEEEFLERKAEFTTSFNTADVHGVYETQVTPLFRALCSIGSSVLSTTKLAYSLNDLKETKRVYLPEINSLNRIYIYSSFSPGKGDNAKGVFAYVTIGPDAHTAEGNVLLFYKGDVQLNAPSLRPYQEKALRELADTTGVVTLSRYVVQHFNNPKEAASVIQGVLMKAVTSDNTIVLLQSHFTFEQLTGPLKITALHQLPIVTLDYVQSDDFFEQPWHNAAFERFTTRFIQLTDNLQRKLQYSSRLNTPIGNVTGNFCMNALDLLFARMLIKSNHVMWYSESDEPDIGHAYSNELISLPGDPHQPLCVDHSGTYLSRCREFRITYMSVAVIIEAQSLFDKALPLHSDPAPSDFSISPTADGLVVVKPVFDILSNFLADLVDRCQGQVNTEILSQMCEQVGTWLGTSTSVFFDPAIHAVFQYFLSTIFHNLVKYFNEAGLTVVYADQSRIILNTGDFPPEQIIEDLRAKPLMQQIMITEIRNAEMDKIVYEKLAWLDQYNFQGIMEDNTYVRNWNVARFLPPSMGTFLTDFFNDLLMFDTDHLIDFFNDKKNILFQFGEDTRNLPGLTPNKLRSLHDNTPNDYILLINIIFHVISSLTKEDGVEQGLAEKITSLRRNALRIIDRSLEYDQRAQYHDPSLHLVVPSVLCTTCLCVRNVDILRDRHILDGNWMCPYCKQLYNIGVFERSIFEEFCRKYQEYQTQDLKCKLCGKVHCRHLSGTCQEDSGALVNKTTKESIRDYMEVVQIAAEYHDLKNLKDVVSSFLDLTK